MLCWERRMSCWYVFPLSYHLPFYYSTGPSDTDSHELVNFSPFCCCYFALSLPVYSKEVSRCKEEKDLEVIFLLLLVSFVQCEEINIVLLFTCCLLLADLCFPKNYGRKLNLQKMKK